MANGESIAEIPEEERLRILVDEQKAISELKKPEELETRISALEKIIRESRLRLQANMSRRSEMVDAMSEAEREEWRKRSKTYKPRTPAVEPKKGGTKAAPMSAHQKAVKSYAAALGISEAEAEAELAKKKEAK